MVTFNVLDFNLASPGAVDGHAICVTGPPSHTLDDYLTSVAVVTGQKENGRVSLTPSWSLFCL